jgi:hypothetical protein
LKKRFRYLENILSYDKNEITIVTYKKTKLRKTANILKQLTTAKEGKNMLFIINCFMPKADSNQQKPL